MDITVNEDTLCEVKEKIWIFKKVKVKKNSGLKGAYMVNLL